MSRLSSFDPDNMSPEQKAVYDKIASGPRGSVRGPFAKLLVNPPVADCAQAMGATLRFGGTLPANLRELAILVTARHWTAQYEWYAHAPIALKGGVAESVLDAIKQRRRPSFTDPNEAVVYEFCNELHEKRDVGDETYNWAVENLGESGVAELIALCGFYTLISMTLNVGRVDLPEGEELPLKP
ncbi:MAG: carboxymuconolactone decarboxylase family protein [Alphaproteobacteria bacterium]